MISGWQGSPFDLRTPGSLRALGEVRVVVVPPDAAAALRSLVLLDTDCERLVFRATVDDEGVVLFGDDDFEELIGYVAAEANHEEDRRRQKRLDAAFATLNDALNEPPGR